MKHVGQILLLVMLAMIVTNAGCEVKRQEETKSRSPVISGKVEAINREESTLPLITDADEISRQDFYRTILESRDNEETYHLLKEVASFLRG